ncbi:hypothetical protein CBFG_00597 [Clostridiales bacterium 1_7_47FAA]|uniref:Uncharacterized protein n=1 Tax=Enterocloster hominis (ex Hitch et al. 2024) TaxID=1917870 RepID=A0ABV1D7U7_9FIRM|nr:hypothetical protein CBFG_00597 [Clostridiales bacterium 1_7_47FAA]
MDCIGPNHICVELYPDLYYNSWIRRLAGGATDWATTQFFNEFWEKAVKDTNAKIFKENSQFGKSQVPAVLYELELIKRWGEINLLDSNREYMKERVENLIDCIPTALPGDFPV